MASRSDLGDVTPNNLGQVKVLHKVLFPVNYDEKFYTELLEAGEFAKLAYYNDVCVGTVCCRKEVDDTNPEFFKVYMMTIGVLEPYRHLGLGSQLFEHILEQAKVAKNISKVYLHAQTNNNRAIEFYKKYDFDIVSTEEDYYKNIEPRDAYLLSKTIEQ
ncbi:acyl-CoA N-acyltransferase [Helicostylum pulchrum]|nr:acyl-CoA N-acyltransferase [Helicostylum pulchrum]